jgi:UDP-N-acetylglucosamine 2-epimerase (non-hydrolysing)
MTKSKIKVLTVVGTRPEIIRLSRTIALLDQHLSHILVHTGQNYDYELNEVFFHDLEIRKPDYFLNIDTSSLGAAVGDIIRKSEEVLKKERPDALLVLGDTNSSLAAYMAKRMHIPIFHMEAGNRSFDFNVPEEINRRIIDHIADFNLVYTEHARRHLISEGLPHRRIYLTGSPMREVLDYYREKIESSEVLSHQSIVDSLKSGTVELSNETTNDQRLTTNDYFLVSFHREENVDNPENLAKILDILNKLAEKYGLPVIVSTHPRTRKRLEDLDPSHFTLHASLQFMKPFGFLDYINLQMHAKCVISDSGTISEESAILGFPAISLRQSMERPEAQDAGTIILTGFDPEVVLDSIGLVIKEFSGSSNQSLVTGHRSFVGGQHSNPEPGTQEHRNIQIPADYQVADTSWRVLKLIMGNARLSNKWWGIER